MNLNDLIQSKDTIIALATPPGTSAIAVLRVSGEEAIQVTNRLFKAKNLEKQKGYTLHFGALTDEEKVIDEVLLSLFKAPKSYTGEDTIEISCHGSNYIVQQIIRLYAKHGVRYAKPGEYTRRAFLNGKFDLAQAEAVADLIASESEMAHSAAMNQMRGGFSQEIQQLREKLIHFASMIELELDFGEEDVEFADRSDLVNLINELKSIIIQLIESFALGNVIKNGVPTVIAGKPNAGKSTLLNAILNEEKAIVSDIPGTTRDFIEDEVMIQGVSFRFVDTAGLRDTTDVVEKLGVERTYEKMKTAALIIYLFDTKTLTQSEFLEEFDKLEGLKIPYVLVGNKVDLLETTPSFLSDRKDILFLSAKEKTDLETLKEKLYEMVNLEGFKVGNTVVTNARHHESLQKTLEALDDVLNGIANEVTGDFLAMDIRQALHHLGEITGTITTDDLLGNIFSKFCIGK